MSISSPAHVPIVDFQSSLVGNPPSRPGDVYHPQGTVLNFHIASVIVGSATATDPRSQTARTHNSAQCRLTEPVNTLSVLLPRRTIGGSSPLMKKNIMIKPTSGEF